MELRERIEAHIRGWEMEAAGLGGIYELAAPGFARIDAAKLILGWLDEAEADAPVLPEGVHRAPDGTLLARGESVPEGWVASTVFGWRSDEHPEVRRGSWYEVRPVPVEPETERVPWWEARGRILSDGRKIQWVGDGLLGPWIQCRTTDDRTAPDADGMVSVLKDQGAADQGGES